MTVTSRRRRRFGKREALVILVAVALLSVAALVLLDLGLLPSGPTAVTKPGSSPGVSARSSRDPSPSAPASPAAALTLASIFDSPPDLSGIDQKRVVTMIATGDVIPARRTNATMVRLNDFTWPFKPTHDFLHSADFVFSNLESPLYQGCPVNAGHTLVFCGDPRFIDGLTYAGITVMNLSNNHITNGGAPGVASTEKLLSDHAIQYTGQGFTPVITVKGVRFGFVGMNGVTAGGPIDRVELKRQIDLVRPQADVVIAQFHWGAEYKLTPQPAPGIAPDDPRDVGHAAIDDGADLVIGNHPHTVEGVEVYKGHLITYAHGNYVFDQDAPWWVPDPGQPDAADGMLGKYTFVDGKLAAVSYRPIRTYLDGQPKFLEGPYGDYVMSLVRLSSQIIAGDAPPQPIPSPKVPRPPSGN